MTVRSRELKATANGSTGGKVVAVAAWTVGVWATVEFIDGIVADGTTMTAIILWATLIQAVMTWAESPLWSGRGRWYNVAVLIIDTVINIGGLFFFVTRLDRTESWAAFNTALGFQGGMNPLAALLVSSILGILLAATPEFLWKQS